MESDYFLHHGYLGPYLPLTKPELVVCNFCIFGDSCKHPTLEKFPKLVEERISNKECDQAMGYDYTGTRYTSYAHLVGEDGKFFWHGRFFRYRPDPDFQSIEAVLRDENTPVLCRECFYNRRGLCTNSMITNDLALQNIPLPVLMSIFSDHKRCLGGAKSDPNSFINSLIGRRLGLKLVDGRVVSFNKKDTLKAWGE